MSLNHDASKIIKDTIDADDDGLRDINLKIHSTPELCFKEYHAHDNIVRFLEDRNFKVKKHAYGLETSFEAEYGEGGRLLVFNAEYDALPGIGHACGHNLIATSSIAAFLGVAAALKESKIPGRVRLLGTPAEEGGGGKLVLIEKGAYRDVDACMMLHPAAPDEDPKFSGKSFSKSSAATQFKVHFTGEAAHAAQHPYEGINALDAVVLGYNAVSMLRQQIRSYERVHGIITKGGAAKNIIPADTSLDYCVRSATIAEMESLQDRVIKCFDAAALATGCKVEYEQAAAYADLYPNYVLCKLYADAMGDLDSPVTLDTSCVISASTDMGNVTYVCPGFHGRFGIPVTEGSANHTPGFTACAATIEAHRLTITAAKGMAIAGWQVLESEEVAAQVRRQFENDDRKRR
ncbi:hypothetical protein HYFRA_00005157 [Hymenoscyphus fraxineus]|uniref:Peptidase M20 domain-containing protein 2 n=1 Tax=Hymenoscyphus fraxineus TaxID=746836 RepID=A0A9N9L9W0_9HELO|nr:hypothetical protein HYFRA_00005157 [Hymenoscyphus fraxineus]